MRPPLAAPTPNPRPQSRRDQAGQRPGPLQDGLILGCLLVGVAALSAPWIGALVLAATLGIAWWAGSWLIAAIGVLFGIVWFGARLLVSLYRV